MKTAVVLSALFAAGTAFADDQTLEIGPEFVKQNGTQLDAKRTPRLTAPKQVNAGTVTLVAMAAPSNAAEWWTDAQITVKATK